MKKILRSTIIGLLIGSLVTWIYLGFTSNQITIIRRDLLVYLIMSALIGAWSTIFSLEKPKFLVKLIAHFIVVSLIVIMAFKLTGILPQNIFNILIPICIIYLGVWISLYIFNFLSVAQLNKAIEKRNTKKH
ncbi:DUF3021 family protein [Lactobacillus sp. YT155]|uniref:DUF3021 family protein n=1 Tax=Lactobacillus sp. YT155 TaxID=3060955 RepID=UPI00265F590E|nr:DUF3021 family protein [Lactobacillus sp. YT155]MDO1605941.1 DUF3021 family protein [Lactobacillus sp. YT155]